jgi:hypothetical protein
VAGKGLVRVCQELSQVGPPRQARTSEIFIGSLDKRTSTCALQNYVASACGIKGTKFWHCQDRASRPYAVNAMSSMSMVQAKSKAPNATGCKVDSTASNRQFRIWACCVWSRCGMRRRPYQQVMALHCWLSGQQTRACSNKQ